MLKSDGKKWGGLYAEMQAFTEKISRQQITFPSSVTIDGKALKGHINWFSHVMPVGERGKEEIGIEFEFSPILKSFLLQLKEYVQVDRLEISKMKNKYSIRLYQLLKAALQKQEKYKNILTRKISVEELREILVDKDKYTTFKAFNQFLLKVAIKEINKFTSMNVEVKSIRGRSKKIETIEFLISTKSMHDPNQLELAMPTKRSWTELTKTEQIKKRKQFNFEQFKKKHRRVYMDKLRELNEIFKNKRPTEEHLKTMIHNTCEQW